MAEDSKTRVCFICHDSDAAGTITPFKKKTFEKCKYSLAVRLYFKLKDSEKELPSEINSTVGYHNKCYRSFTAIRKRYRDTYVKAINPEDGESVSDTIQTPEAERNTAEQHFYRPGHSSERESWPAVNNYESSYNLCEEDKYSICCGCLSVDRHVKPIMEFLDLFASLLGEKNNDIKLFNMELCWECIALLKRIKIFQKRIIKASFLLSTLHSMGTLHTVKSLSTLSTMQQDSCQVVVQHDSEECTTTEDDTLNKIKDIKDENEQYYLDDYHDQYYDEDEQDCDFKADTEELKTTKDIKDEYEDNDLNHYYNQYDEDKQDCNLKAGNEEKEVVENSIELKTQGGNIEFEVEIVNLKADQNKLDAENKHDLILDDKRKKCCVKKGIKFRNNLTNKTVPKIPSNEIITKLTNSTLQKSLVDETIFSEIDNLKADHNKLDTENNSDMTSEDSHKKCYVKKAIKFRNQLTNKTIPKIPSNEIILYEDFLTMKLWNKIDIKKIKRNLNSLCDATIVKTDIDLSDISNVWKYYTEVKMSKEDLEEALEKKKQNLDFISMKFKCELCATGFTASGNLKRHQRLYHIKAKVPSECVMCKHTFPTRHAMLTHMAIQHRTLRCRACDHLCWGRSMPVTHLKNHLFTYTCNFCSERFNSIDSFVSHRKRAHRGCICDLCGHMTKTKGVMVKHLRSHVTQPLECKECDKRFSSRSTYRNHVALLHTVAEHDREACYCVECDLQFNNMRKYQQHLKTSIRHSKTRQRGGTIPCAECGKMVTRKYMRNHFNLYHLKKNNHYCEICDKYFVSSSSVRKHRMYVHDKEAKPRDKVCNVCGRAFHSNTILANHMRTHTGERPFPCKYCGVSFAQKSAMKMHERRHTKPAA